MNTRALFALILKDIRVFLSDRYSVVLSFVAPIVLASFMASIFGGLGPTPSSRIPIIIVDEDDTEISRAIVRGADADPKLTIRQATIEVAKSSVRKSEAVAVVVIPQRFGSLSAEALMGDGEPPDLRFVYEPTKKSEFNLAQGLLTRVILEAVSADSALELDDDFLKPDIVKSETDVVEDDALHHAEFLALFPGLSRDESSTDPSARIELIEAFPGIIEWIDEDRNLDLVGENRADSPLRSRRGLTLPYRSSEISISNGVDGDRGVLAAHSFSGMVVQFVLFSSVEWAVALLVERQRGIWKRLRISPVSRNVLLIGRVMSNLLISFIIIFTVFGFGLVVFQFDIRGSRIAFVLVSLAFAWMASNFGLMVAAYGRTAKGARSIAVLAVLVMVMLGGGWIPSFLFPEWLQTYTQAIPAKWAIDGFDNALSRDFTLSEMAPAIYALFGFGLGFGVLARLGFRWSEP